MKFIHTADLHIGSKINVRINNLSSTIVQRVNNSLDELSQYAKNNDIEVIVIAGDLFDSKNMSISTINSILNTINNYPNIYYLYALGNHDKVNFLSNFELPKNLIIFNKDYEMITIHDVNFIGVNFYNDSVLDKYKNIPSLDSDKKNVLIIHGEIYSGDKIEAKKINLKKFIEKNINYLALGHIHMNSVNILDGNGVYVYPGCLFARGFDELGKKGFYLVDSLDLLHPTFITNDFLRPISFFKLDIDISNAKNNKTGTRIRHHLQDSSAHQDRMQEILYRIVQELLQYPGVFLSLIFIRGTDDFQTVLVELEVVLQVGLREYGAAVGLREESDGLHGLFQEALGHGHSLLLLTALDVQVDGIEDHLLVDIHYGSGGVEREVAVGIGLLHAVEHLHHFIFLAFVVQGYGCLHEHESLTGHSVERGYVLIIHEEILGEGVQTVDIHDAVVHRVSIHLFH